MIRGFGGGFLRVLSLKKVFRKPEKRPREHLSSTVSVHGHLSSTTHSLFGPWAGKRGIKVRFSNSLHAHLVLATLSSSSRGASGKWWGHGWGGDSESRVKRQKQDMKRLSSLKEAYKEKKKKKWKQVSIKRECDVDERAKAKSNGFLATLNGRVRKRKADNWEMSVKQNESKEINNKKAENGWEENMRTDDSESWWIGKGDSEIKDESKEMWERQNIERKVEAIHKTHGWP